VGKAKERAGAILRGETDELQPTTRFHDLRHSAVTRLLEAGVPYPVAVALINANTQRPRSLAAALVRVVDEFRQRCYCLWIPSAVNVTIIVSPGLPSGPTGLPFEVTSMPPALPTTMRSLSFAL
jgi:hypothetical protein